jgi:hypothetical protein
MGRAFPQRGGRAVDEHSEIYVGLDVAKARHAVAVAGGERQGEVRYLGEIDADPASVRRMVARLEKRASDGAFLLRGRADRVWALLANRGNGTSLYGGRTVADPEAAGRPGEDEPTRRH